MRPTVRAGAGVLVGVAALLALGSGLMAGESTVAAAPRDADAPAATAPSSVRTTGPVRIGSRRDTLPDVVAGHVASAARRDTEAYQVPTAGEAARVATAVDHALRGDLDVAVSLLAPVGYQVVRLRTPDGRRFILVEETLGRNGGPERNWGLFVLAPDAGADLLVEVAHPVHDIDSHEVGVEVFEAARGRALLVAGAHRYANRDGSADVAQTPGSVFEAVHATLLRTGTVVLQPHGFATESHPGLGEIVVSAGVAPPPPLVATLAEDLGAIAEVCLYHGDDCRALAGTRNVQGRSARAAGATFVHVELSRRLRSEAELRAPLVGRTADRLVGGGPA